MSLPATLYPPTPKDVPASVTQVSPNFKKEVKGVMGSIVLFFVIYLLMFLLSIMLLICCIYAGLAIIVNVRHLVAIFAGIGLIGLALMVFIFLIKFMFAVNKFDRSQSIEITETDQPELFNFIRRLAADTQAPFPKKIYLSPDVNACVFYDSGFWSMFLPIRKNLQIGLGLVNTVNLSEFKAVMAHEFGHFSQRSMKLGSFVYNVNKIIHNMLFNNTSYAVFLGKWARISDVFAFFAAMTARVARGIQWVLRMVYGLINVRYMSLSREMEFHADAVAASVSGSRSLVSALRRIEFAHGGFGIAVQKCNDLFTQNKITDNIYVNQLQVMNHLAAEHKLSFHKGLPVIPGDFTGLEGKTRVIYSDQWASHPSTADRAKRLMELNVEADESDEPAWSLFQNTTFLQQQLTEKLYEKAWKGRKGFQLVNAEEFEQKWKNDLQQKSLPAAYKGFYDDRQVNIPAEETEDSLFNLKPGKENLEQILTPENVVLPKQIEMAGRDIETLKSIAEKRVDVRSFDFDGQKYPAQEAGAMLEKVEAELKQYEQRLRSVDEELIGFFVNRVPVQYRDEIILKYKDYFKYKRKADAYLQHMNSLLGVLTPVFTSRVTSIDHIQQIIADLKQNYEPEWKQMMGEWLELGAFDEEPIAVEKIKQLIASDYQYFDGNLYIETELADVNEWCHRGWAFVHHWLFLKFKSLLEWQLELVEEKAVA